MKSIKAENVVLSNGIDLESMSNLLAKFATEAKTSPFNQLICSVGVNNIDVDGIIIPYASSNRIANVSDNLKLENSKYVITPKTESIFNVIQISGTLQIETNNTTGNTVSKRLVLVPRYYAPDDVAFTSPTEVTSVQHEMSIEIVNGTRQHQFPFLFNIALNTSAAGAFDLFIKSGSDTSGVTYRTIRRSSVKWEGISAQYN